MKWVARFKDRVTSPFAPPVPTRQDLNDDGTFRTRPETEQDFKRYWDDFRSSNSEKEKEEALEIAVDVFCKLSKKFGNAPQLVSIGTTGRLVGLRIVPIFHVVYEVKYKPLMLISKGIISAPHVLRDHFGSVQGIRKKPEILTARVQALPDARLFPFVVARALFMDIDKLRRESPNYILQLEDVLNYFSEGPTEEPSFGMNLLFALEGLISPPLDVKPLLDADLLSCLVSILYRLLGSTSTSSRTTPSKQGVQSGKDDSVLESDDPGQHPNVVIENSELKHRLVVEGGVVHVMKALAQHPGAAEHLADDDSLQLLFQIIKMGSNSSGLRNMDSSSDPPVHKAQLHRHSLQILSLLLVSDNGSTAEYIHTHQLIELLLKSVKDFDIETGDPTYTLGVVTLLFDCLQLSSQQEAGGVRLREDLKKANGYQLFVQLALKLVGFSSDARTMKIIPASTSGENGGSPVGTSSPTPLLMMSASGEGNTDTASSDLAPYVLRLLDFLVELSQVGEYEPVTGSKGGKAAGIAKHMSQPTSCLPLFDGLGTGGFEIKGREVDGRVRDTDAVRVFQDLFLQSDNTSLRLEVLDRFFRLLSSHPDNYSVIQELRTIPVFVQNMGSFPAVLQERLLKVLEYAVTVVNCVPEQELLSLCYLLQQPLDSIMRAKVLSFFVKLLSFDRQYKKVFREVGLLDLLVDDLKFCELPASDTADHLYELTGRMAGSPVGPNSSRSVELSVVEEKMPAVLISRPGPGNPHIFGDPITLPGAWKCLHSLLERSEGNQLVFRNVGGIGVILPLLVSSEHRSGALRVLSCLICEDNSQTHSEEFGGLIRILKAGFVSDTSGGQWKLGIESKTDMLWAVWRILGSTPTTKGVFGETKGFALLLTIFQGIQVVEDWARTTKTLDESQLYTGETSANAWKAVDALLHVVTAGASNNRLNRIQLHENLMSQTFKDHLASSVILCHEYEEKLVNSLFDVALERAGSLSGTSERSDDLPMLLTLENGDSTSLEDSDDIIDDIQNPGAIEVLISVLLKFSTKLQLKMLMRVERLARVGPHNQDALTSVGCVGLLLGAMHMMLGSTSPLLTNILQIIDVLGVYRLSSSEFRTLGNYLWQSRESSVGFVGRKLLETFERMSRSEGVSSESVSLSPFVEFNMTRTGHACMRISLGERGWPPAVGYSFACWFRYQYSATGFSTADLAMVSGTNSSIKKTSGSDRHLRLLTVGTAEEKSSTCAELYMNELGVLTLATSSTSYLSFKGVRLEEGVWYNLVVVHSKPNALAGLFQSSVASLYINGNLRQTGKLGYTASPPGKALQVTIGTPASGAEVSSLSWRLGPCYLFEEVLFAPAVFFLYCLGRGYRGTFQDTDLLRFVPYEACGDGNLARLEALETELMPNSQKGDIGRSSTKPRGSGIVWDLERLVGPWMQLSSKKLIFAFDGTHPHTLVTSSVSSIYNLVDPASAAASPSGGLPRFARLHGDVYICTPRSIGDNVHMVGGVAVVLALIEASETREMLRCALSLLVNVLYANPRNLRDMLSCRGYHLLALFLHRRMSLFKIQDLDLLFRIAACEASPFLPSRKPWEPASTGVVLPKVPGSVHPDLDSAAFHSKLHDDEQASSLGSPFDQSDFLGHEDVLQTISESGSEGTTDTAPRNSIVLSNPDMMEHVLLDWTLWVTAPVPIQLYLLKFIEQLVSMHRYRVHNLTTLRRINIVQHLLVTLQRGEVETPVLEKLVVLLGVLLEDGFLPAELKYVADFVVMTFDPPVVPGAVNVTREQMSVQVQVRNMLLDMIIDLQVTISGEEVLETWLKIVSSTLIAILLDEAVDAATMRRVMTLLGVCLSSSPLFLAKFRGNGGYQALVHVLPSFYDSPEVYYMLFCLLFGKPVYPRLPEVRMRDFHALMPNDGGAEELHFTDLLESVIAMAKAVFDRMTIISQKAQESGDFTQFYALLAYSFSDGVGGTGETLQGEALLHKTFAARLMSGDSAAPGLVTSLIRFMVDLAKMYHPFSVACRRASFLECCVDLYFSCARAAAAIQGAQLDSRLAQPQQVEQERQGNMWDKKQTSNLERSEIINAGTSPLKTEKVSSEEGPTDSFAEFKDQTNCMPGLSKPLNSTEPDLKELDVAVIHIAPKSPSGETNGSDQPIKWGTNESPPQSESSGLASGLSTQKSLDHESSPVGAVNPWFGAFTPSEVSSRLHSVSSINTSTIGSGDFGGQETGTAGLNLGSETSLNPVQANLLVQLEDEGTVGGPCSSGASAVLDLLAEIFAEVLTEQPKGVLMMEAALEAVPLYVDSDVVLIFQGLCLSRVMNVLERRLIRDDEEIEKKLDKSRWGPNLEMLSTLLVDRVYAGAFTDAGGTLKVLEFLLAMLLMANKDRQVEDATPASKGLLSLTRGGFRQVEPFVQALLKNANRMFMYSFLPSSLTGTTDWIRQSQDSPVRSYEDLGLGLRCLDIHTSLKLIVAHKKLLLCASNLDLEFTSCLCAKVTPMLWDPRQNVKNLALEVWRALLQYRGSSLEELLICKGVQGEVLDIMHGGFNRLPTNARDFFLWLDDARDMVNATLDQRVSPMWTDYVGGAARFPGAKVKALEGRRKREMGRRYREISKENSRHWEQMVQRRVASDVIREAMAAELRVMRQDKYGWVLHAESEWSGHFQKLVHERGIWPMAICQSQTAAVDGEPLWELCTTEGPYRMRKKLERCKFELHLSQNSPETDGDNITDETLVPADNESTEYGISAIKRFHLPASGPGPDDGSVDAESLQYKHGELDGVTDSKEAGGRLSDTQRATVVGVVPPPSTSSNGDKSAVSVDGSFPIDGRGVESTRPSTAPGTEDIVRNEEKKLDKVINDDGEYLIRPHLQPGEKILFRYNCERVVGLDKHDGMFLIGERSLYVIEHYYIDDEGRITEKAWEGELSVIDRALGVKINTAGGASLHEPEKLEDITNSKSVDTWLGGRAWALTGGAWGKESVKTGKHLTHTWRMWKLESVHELLKRRYQLRPVAIELFSMDGCNELLVFHKEQRDEVFKNLVALNLPRNSLLDTTISGVSKHESGEGGGRIFKVMAKSFSRRWQNGEISNFQYLMHLNTLAGRGYNDLTQYPVFPWILSDYQSEELDLNDPAVFRPLDKPMGALSPEREEEFRKRYESWEDPEIPRFHYGSHYSSAGSVLFYLIRLPPFSKENRHLQGGQFDHADRLFNSLRDTWLSASQGNTADVKELIPEFFYLPEFLENRFNFDFGVKQSGETVNDVLLPPWAKGSAREFVRKHREALESQYVSENLHHWIDLIFGFQQRGKPAVDATNVFFYLTYEGAVDIDSIHDPAMKASILAQINHFGQTPRQLFTKPHPKRKWQPQTALTQTLCNYQLLVPQELRTLDSSVSQIVIFHDRIYVAAGNQVLKPPSYSKYLAWGYQDRSLRFISYDQDKLLSTHEGLHDCGPVCCAGMSRDGKVLVTGGEDGVVAVWRQRKDGTRGSRRLHLLKALCGHTKRVTCLSVCQPYSLVVSGSLDRTVIFWDLTSLEFVRQLPELPAPASAVYTNDMTGEVVTAAGSTLAVWSINGDCLAAINTSQIASDSILSITSPHLSDWMEVSWYITGHKNGSIKIWRMKTSYKTDGDKLQSYSYRRFTAEKSSTSQVTEADTKRRDFTNGMTPEYHLVLYELLSWHNEPVTAISLSHDLKQLYSGDGGGHVIAWTLPEEGLKQSASPEILKCSSCTKIIAANSDADHCRNCGQLSCRTCLEKKIVLQDLGYVNPMPVCMDCFDSRSSLSSLTSFRSARTASNHNLWRDLTPQPLTLSRSSLKHK